MDRRPQDRVLVAVLFLDIVGSTEVATELGDERWQELLRRYRAVVRGELRRFRGREVDTAGDGFFATFERPADGVSAAGSIVEAVRELGIEVRAGLHFGECEVRGAELSGIAVHTGARVMGVAGPGEVLVTATVRDLVAGARLQFEGWGVHTLKGVPGEWRLYTLVSTDGQKLGSPLEDATAVERRDAITPAPVRRRRGVMIAGGVVVLAIAATAIALLTADEKNIQDGRGSPIAQDALVRIDPATNQVVARVGPLPRTEPRSRFMDVAVGQGAVWVENFETGMLTKVDPQANRIEEA